MMWINVQRIGRRTGQGCHAHGSSIYCRRHKLISHLTRTEDKRANHNQRTDPGRTGRCLGESGHHDQCRWCLGGSFGSCWQPEIRCILDSSPGCTPFWQVTSLGHCVTSPNIRRMSCRTEFHATDCCFDGTASGAQRRPCCSVWIEC